MVDSLATIAQASAQVTTPIIDTMMNNIVLAPILWWFMREHNRLIRAFSAEQKLNREEQIKGREIMQSVRDVIHRCGK